MSVIGTNASVTADAIGMIAVGLMWAISLAALAGLAWLMGKWMRNREERRKRPLVPAATSQQGPQDAQAAMSRGTKRSVKKGQRRQENASDLDGYL